MRWCETCFEPNEAARRIAGSNTQCPIQKRALDTGRKPVQWDRTRSKDMETSIRCNEYQPRPKSTARGTANEFDVPQDSLFDVKHGAYHLVPVEGWPDPPTRNEVDHA